MNITVGNGRVGIYFHSVLFFPWFFGDIKRTERKGKGDLYFSLSFLWRFTLIFLLIFSLSLSFLVPIITHVKTPNTTPSIQSCKPLDNCTTVSNRGKNP